jgi:asparagine synthase (glutamine-hydrolysing)
MCGIVGIFNLNSEPVNQELLLGMTRLLSHRGPDDEGLYLCGKVGLGHRRLSIIDLSVRGHQPMSNEDGSIWIVFNGEIYNHISLRKQLQANGHQYKSDTDTETIIHLYEDKGIECLDYLDGEFAFSIWDANRKTIFSARDRLGVKPLYYYISDKYFIFASEIKAILLHPKVKKDINPQALSHYLSFSVSPAPLTCFKDIFKLEAGHFLLVGDDGKITKTQYWDAIPKTKINCSQEEAVETIRIKLKESVRERLMSDVPFGVFLSGGIDSSTNVALMSHMIKEPVKTFNVAIEGSNTYDESYFAKLVSEHFHTEYHSLRIKFDDFSKVFDDLAYYSDEPLCDYACIPNFYLAKLAREKGVYVIQVGEGNDEIFCGYRSYIAVLNLIRLFYPFPSLLKKPAFQLLKLAQVDKLHYTIERAANGEEVFLGGSYLFTEKEKERLFNKSMNTSGLDSSSAYVSGIYRNYLDRFPEADPLDKMIYLDLKVRLPELLLMRTDKMTMANSVEARVPFLDYQFVEYALSLPTKFKYHHNTGKYIFRKSLRGILPQKVVSQRKKGFAGLPVNIFDRDFQKYILGLYQETEPFLGQYFDLEYMKSILSSDHSRLNFTQSMKIWSIFSLMLWIKRFFICQK